VELTYEDSSSSSNTLESEIFDAVCICNGHYALPSNPQIQGLDQHFTGTVLHSISYDDPSIFTDQTVLCVGGRASGSDVAREVSSFAKRVYLSDPTCPSFSNGEPETRGKVTLVPRTASINQDGVFAFRGNDDGNGWNVDDVDVVIFCSGYDYHFPFLEKENSNLNVECVRGERRVSPLFAQLWHANYPNIAFVGLPHSVVPMPLCELQAEAFAHQLQIAMSTIKASNTNAHQLPSLQQRLLSANKDAESGGPNQGRVQETHFLGSYQWDYCRSLAKYANNYNEDMENYIATNKAIYDHAGKERKKLFPGGEDVYRETRYSRCDETRSFGVSTTTTTITKPQQEE